MSKTEKFLTDLRAVAWRTGGARFNAARRLKRRDLFATFSIAGFSAAGIGVAFIQKVYEVTAGTPADKYLTALSLCLGLFVVVISLIEWGASGAVRAESLFQNAQKLSAYHRKLAQRLSELADGGNTSSDEVTRLREEYEHIKDECPHNHEPIDDQLFLVQRRLDSGFCDLFGRPKPSWFDAQWTALRSFLSVVWYFGLFWLAIGGLLLATPWKGS
jgi:SMODS and SLOG-associating 2TM effector domain family 5